MTTSAQRVQRTYLALTLFSTLAASFIWGINTLFLLDAGLSNCRENASSDPITADIDDSESGPGRLKPGLATIGLSFGPC